ncbi:uncharacterized protein LOC118563713 [Fundulus heteroclitus]|uniref:uncharacterized protein LOC118563713 n=1 Tax=Fundulus heteroclitus TaxID=8078 RepID=UPI00165A897A|nr:uncharacterized protein LOC118563713 [Fundulus heteroclitus]
MRHLCVPLFLVIISGVPTQTADKVRAVVGYEGDDVILPCNCVNRNLKEGFKWKTENPETLIFKVEPTEEINWGNYKTRVVMFVNESSSNCSILLKKITEDDKKTYTCSFKMKEVHKVHAVNLKVMQRPATRSTATRSTVPAAIPTKDSQRGIVPSEPPKPPRQYFTIIPVVALLLIVGYLGNIYLKHRRNWGAPDQGDTPLSSEDNV